jgi:hypothetical protein
VVSPEIEDRDEVEVATGRSTKRQSQFSNFKVSVISTFLVIFLVLEIAIKSTTISTLSDLLSANFQVKLSQNGE